MVRSDRRLPGASPRREARQKMIDPVAGPEGSNQPFRLLHRLPQNNRAGRIPALEWGRPRP
eukprot:gene20813-biopygen16143